MILNGFSFIFLLTLYASVYFLTALSVDRYFSVCYPIISRKIRNDTARYHLWNKILRIGLSESYK